MSQGLVLPDTAPNFRVPRWTIPTFDFGGTSYTVTAFNVATGGTLGFAISPVLSDRAKSLLRLDIGSTKLAFKDATLADFGPDDGNYSLLNWNTSLSWSDGDSVSLSITEVNAAAEGKPSVVVDGPGVFAADTSGITDENGLGALSYQWVSVDGGTDTDISGATGQTYPVTGSETGDSIKVRVTFTDQGGFTEGPFTSDSVMMLKPDEIWAAIMTVGSLGPRRLHCKGIRERLRLSQRHHGQLRLDHLHGVGNQARSGMCQHSANMTLNFKSTRPCRTNTGAPGYSCNDGE